MQIAFGRVRRKTSPAKRDGVGFVRRGWNADRIWSSTPQNLASEEGTGLVAGPARLHEV